MTSLIKSRRVQVASDGILLVGDCWQPRTGSKGNVILLHGGGQRRFSWRQTGSWLAASEWTAFAFDARGHGDSGWAPNRDYSISALVGDLKAVVETVTETPPILVGASVGGLSALMAIGENAVNARGLVLVDIAARIDPAGAKRIEEFMQAAPDGFATLEEASEAIAAYNPHRPRSRSLDGLRKNLRLGPDGRWRWHWDPAFLDGGIEPERDVRYERAKAAARRVVTPTLLVRGARSDLVSKASIEEMQQLILHARAVEVHSAGHMIAGDDNDVFTTELLGFIESTMA